MKTNTILPSLNLESFYAFVKLDKIEQCELLTEQGIILDLECEKDTITRLYFLNGFFVEETISKSKNEVIDVIPYKQGYRLESYLGEKRTQFSGKLIKLQWCVN